MKKKSIILIVLFLVIINAIGIFLIFFDTDKPIRKVRNDNELIGLYNGIEPGINEVFAKAVAMPFSLFMNDWWYDKKVYTDVDYVEFATNDSVLTTRRNCKRC